MNQFVFLTLAFRGTERVPTEEGRALDKIKVFDSGYSEAFVRGHDGPSLGNSLNLAGGDVYAHAKLTEVMRSLISGMFSTIREYASETTLKTTPVVHFRLEGMDSPMRLRHALVVRSEAESAGGVEGDDLLVVLLFEASTTAENVVILDRRFCHAEEAQKFLSMMGIENSDSTLKSLFRPGFYLLTEERVMKDSDRLNEMEEWLEHPSSRVAACLIAAYLFYCWLFCLRTERLAASINLNGDWDAEVRKLILARKRLAVGWKYATIKNRAEPDSPILPLFFGMSRAYRLEEQMKNLTALLDESAKAMETQNNYVLFNRVKTIETIIFLSSVLGLGVATNAIQMPPFFDGKAENALTRPEFWSVFAVIFSGAIVIWGAHFAWPWIKNVRRLAVSAVRRCQRK